MHKNHTEGQIAADIFARIEKEGICPRPKWHFLMRESVVWSLGIASIVVGALALCGTLFEFRNAWWDVYEATHESFFMFVWDMLPLVWVAVFGLFLFSAYSFLRATRRGYRYSFTLVVVVSLVSTGVLGVAFHVVGAGRFVDERVGAFMPFHHSLMVREREVWMLPAEGRIAGVVREIPFAEDIFWIEGVDGKPYRVLMNLPEKDRMRIRVGEAVRVVGMPTSTHGVLAGCIMFIKDDDILREIHMRPRDGQERGLSTVKPERKIFFARSTECKEVRSYARMAPVGSY